jgi:hypothetical protein
MSWGASSTSLFLQGHDYKGAIDYEEATTCSGLGATLEAPTHRHKIVPRVVAGEVDVTPEKDWVRALSSCPLCTQRQAARLNAPVLILNL